MAAANFRTGAKVRPHFSIIVLCFGFLIIYNALSWLPAFMSKLRLAHINFGDVRLELALPAVIMVIILWLLLARIGDRR